MLRCARVHVHLGAHVGAHACMCACMHTQVGMRMCKQDANNRAVFILKGFQRGFDYLSEAQMINILSEDPKMETSIDY